MQLWLTGDAADDIKEQGAPPEVADCIGKTRAQACKVDTKDAKQSQTFPAGEKDQVPEDDAESQEGRDVIEVIEKIFAQDIGVGDRFVVSGETEQDGPDGEFDVSFTFEMFVPKTERVTTKAGSFDAVVVTQEARFVADVEHLSESNYDYETGRSTYEPRLQNLQLNETVTRTTIWLDARTWQPLKIESTFPMDLDAVLDKALASMTEDAWEGSPFGRLTGEQIGVKVEGRSVIELTERAGETRFSPVLGLALASMLGGSAGAIAGPFAMGLGPGMGMGHAVAEPVPPPYPYPGYSPYPTMSPTTPYPGYSPAKSLAISSAGPLTGGQKEYTVARASDGMVWGDLVFTVDGEEWYYWYGETCDEVEPGYYSVCADGSVEDPYEGTVDAGDVLTLSGVESGQTLRVIDAYANSVILSLTIS